jgi:histidinol phosphatase-like enzyme (inositol monophosphatase family)
MAVSSNELMELCRFATDLAEVARPILRTYFRQGVHVEHKPDRTPVTVADRVTERVLRTMINERFPEHGLNGEEYGGEDSGAAFCWVIDPIDGTKSFVSGIPLFGTLIGLLHEGQPVLGVLEMPALGERWLGARGLATTLNDEPCRTSGCERLDSAIVCATTPDMFQGDDRPRFEAVSSRCRFTRFGTDCYAYGLLASGHVDLVVEAQMQPYDILGVVAVIEGAGGVVTDWAGSSLGLGGETRVVAAANPALHERALDLLR